MGTVTMLELSKELNRKSPSELIEYLQSLKLIAKAGKCSKCDVEMRLRTCENRSDKYIWKCPKCKTTRSLRSGSWFESSNLPFRTILCLTYMWLLKYPERLVYHELHISRRTVVYWYNFYRDTCIEIVLKQINQIGGSDTIVEIDESKFEQRKNHRGRQVEGQWVFGGFERGSNNCFLAMVEDRSPEVLIDLIKRFILPGTAIVSNCWKAYEFLGREGCTHLIADHSVTFVDKATDECNTTIEDTWTHVKRQFPDCHRKKDKFSAYLAEFMYRRLRNNVPDEFVAFLSDIAAIYTSNTY